MKSFNAYLIFNGNCRQAMEFYAKSLGADLQLMTYGQGPGGGPGCEIPEQVKDNIMHARLQKGNAVLMASDSTPERAVKPGTNFWVNIDCENLQEIEKFFSALSDGASITLPLQQTFWAARFAMLTDKFGVNWMLNLEQPKNSDGHGQREEDKVLVNR
jgi:PhnB protein